MSKLSIGQRAVYWAAIMEDGVKRNPVVTIVDSEPVMMGGHTETVKVRDVSGYVATSHVFPLPEVQIPRHADKRFETQEEFDKWLAETAYEKVALVDIGQDLSVIWLDEFGEIIHSNMQTEIWCGTFVYHLDIHPGQNLLFALKHDREWRVMNFVCEKVENLQ